MFCHRWEPTSSCWTTAAHWAQYRCRAERREPRKSEEVSKRDGLGVFYFRTCLMALFHISQSKQFKGGVGCVCGARTFLVNLLR